VFFEVIFVFFLAHTRAISELFPGGILRLHGSGFVTGIVTRRRPISERIAIFCHRGKILSSILFFALQ